MKYFKYFLIASFLLANLSLVIYYMDYLGWIDVIPKRRVLAMMVEVPGIKVEMDESTDWLTISKMMVCTLGSYAGVKIINLVFKKWE